MVRKGAVRNNIYRTMAEEQGIISYDPATTNMVLDRMYQNRNAFPFDTEAKPESEKGITSGAVYDALKNFEGGTNDYNDLDNKPSINNVPLEGSKSLDDLGIQKKGDYATKDELKNATPSIGENGNWYIGGSDTGKSSKGADGVSLGEIALVQETGTGSGSEKRVMSQKAVTEKLSELESKNMFDIVVFTGGYQSDGTVLENSTRCHTLLVNGVKAITAASGYQIAVLIVEDDRLNTEYFSWVSNLTFEAAKSIKINIKKNDNSNISVEEAKKAILISLIGNVSPSNIQEQIDNSNTELQKLSTKAINLEEAIFSIEETQKYQKTDYTSPLWYEGSIGGKVKSRTDTASTSAILVDIPENAIMFDVVGKGGTIGRLWYQLDESETILAMADALQINAQKIAIVPGCKKIVAQTNENTSSYSLVLLGASKENKIESLENKINETVSLRDNEEVDLTFSDEEGNVLVEFSNGHIKTKNFDSSKIETNTNTDNPLKGKILSILADSISTFGVPDQNNATGTWTYPGNRCRYPQANLLTDVNLTYWKRLIDNNNMLLGINESWAGSRVSNTQPTDSGDFGPNRCISSVTRISHLGENGTPDYIVVYAATNDAGGKVELGKFNTESPKDYTKEQIDSLDVSNFADAYRAMLIRLMYYYPTSKILVLMPNFTSTYYTIDNLDKYIEIIREACDFFGIPYLDLRTCGVTIFNHTRYLPDGIHPNAACMELIYMALQNKLQLI